MQQKARLQQLLNSVQRKPLAPSYLLSALKAELANLDTIYASYKQLILTVTQLLKGNLLSMAYYLYVNAPREASYPS